MSGLIDGKMSFNPDLSNEGVEVYFTRKSASANDAAITSIDY